MPPEIYELQIWGLFRFKNIPKKFVKKYGEHLSDSVCLKIPSGCEWEVGVTRNGNKVWFEQGWPAFAKFYSLNYGVFLLFRYEGNSKFQVCIFDTSATEIAYRIRIEEPDNINCEDDDNSVEVLDDFSHPYCPKTREKSPLPSPRPHKRRKISSNSEGKIQGKTDIIGKEHGGGSSSTQNVRKETPKVCGMKHSSTAKTKTTALERAAGFTSEKPFSIVTMHPSYVQSNTMNLRGSFVKNFATQHQLVKLQKIQPKFVMKYGDYLSKSVRLKLPSGCQWQVEVTKSDSEVWFDKGWPEFFKFYTLNYGHLVIFTYHGNSMFEVCIFDRTATEIEYPIIMDKSYVESEPSIEKLEDFIPCPKIRDNSPSPSGKEDDFSRKNDGGDPATALQRAKAFKSENAFIMIFMEPSYIDRYSVSIPFRFVMNFAKFRQQAVKLLVGDRSWPARLNVFSLYGKAKISSGWHEFVKENHLRLGDVCIFELMKVNDLVPKVHIFRG
ncbi:hypothetical protein ACLB2K_003570 [Fragaria x ananassa]